MFKSFTARAIGAYIKQNQWVYYLLHQNAVSLPNGAKVLKVLFEWKCT
jgi:hypothetical protein